MTNNKEIEIDLFHLLKLIWVRKLWIIMVALVFGVTALLYSALIAQPVYTSTTRIYVVNQNTAPNTITTQDLQAGNYLVKDYKEIITSKDVLMTVVENEQLKLTADQLYGKVAVTIPPDTRIVTISVNDTDPKQAADLANAVRDVAAEKIKLVTKVPDVTTIDNAEIPEKPSAPNVKRNTMIAAFTGIIVACVLVLLIELFNDRVRRPEDVEETMGMSLLGLIPDTNKL